MEKLGFLTDGKCFLEMGAGKGISFIIQTLVCNGYFSDNLKLLFCITFNIKIWRLISVGTTCSKT